MQNNRGEYNLSVNNYRYTYNGMEVDHEVSGSGNSYTTQFRQYDPRLGRWKSLDPLAAKYPSQSPFVGFNDNPVYFVDPLGLEGDDPHNPHVIIWFQKGTMQNTVAFAEGLKEEYVGNTFHVFAHAASTHIDAVDKDGNKDVLYSGGEFVEYLAKTSPAFAAALESGEPITIILHACNSGSDTRGDGRPNNNPIAKQISAYKGEDGSHNYDITVIAPDGKCCFKPGPDPQGRSDGNGYQEGVFDKFQAPDKITGKKGSMGTFKNGIKTGRNPYPGLTEPGDSRRLRKAMRGVDKLSKTKLNIGTKLRNAFKRQPGKAIRWGRKAKF